MMIVGIASCLLLSVLVQVHALRPCQSNELLREKRQASCLPVLDSIDPEVNLVVALIKQGDHNPETFFSPPPTTWGFEGADKLSEAGKRQTYGFGQSLRKFVGPSFVNANYFASDFQGFTASSGYDQQSLALALAGFYPPVGFANWNSALPWSPVPYTINDSLLNLGPSNCPNYNAAWQPIDDETLPAYVTLYAAKKPLIDYIAANTGWNSSVSTGELAAANIHDIILNNASFPSWIENPTLANYTKASIIADILDSFFYIDSITCSNYAPCRNLEGASLIATVGLSIVSFNASLPQSNQINLYVSHTEEVLSDIHLAFLRRDTLPDAGGLIILYRPTPSPALRLIFSEPIDQLSDTNFEHMFYQAEYLPERAAICDADYWCPLDADISLVVGSTQSRTQACGAVSCL